VCTLARAHGITTRAILEYLYTDTNIDSPRPFFISRSVGIDLGFRRIELGPIHVAMVSIVIAVVSLVKLIATSFADDKKREFLGNTRNIFSNI
jgi:hypothetical protein